MFQLSRIQTRPLTMAAKASPCHNPVFSQFVADISSNQRQGHGESIEYWKYEPFHPAIQNEFIEYWKYEPRSRYFLD